MIVKNEADVLGRCLSSVRDAVDQIVVVDTGSTDKTPEICRQYGAEVYPFTWTDHFAAARNFGLKKAKGIWTLWLDADEWMDFMSPEGASALRRTLAVTNAALFPLRMVHFMGESPDPYHVFYSESYRIFLTDVGVRFVGRIHEHPELPQTFDRKRIGAALPVQLLHDGYLIPSVQKKEKATRNVTLLKKERQRATYSPWVDFHLADEYYNLGAYPAAFAYINDALRGFATRKQAPPAILYHLKYSILLVAGNDVAQTLLGLEKALELYPDYVDLQFFKGVLLLALGQTECAARIFCYCIILGDDHTDYLTYRGYGSYYAYYYLGRAYEAMENISLACDAYEQALELYPGYEQADRALHLLRPSCGK